MRMQPVPERSLALDFLCRRLAVARDRVAIPMSRVAAVMVKQSVWHACSYVRASDFTRERLRRGSRWLNDLARLHTALHELPALAAALCGDDGKLPIGRVAALRIGGVASTESVDAWIERARSCTVRELTKDLSQARQSRTSWPPGSGSPSTEKAQASEHQAKSARKRSAEHVKELPAAEPERSTTTEDDDDDQVRANVVVPVPGPVLAAFEEALDLHRAVVGRESPVADFVDALTGESSAGRVADARSPMDDVAVRPVERARALRMKEVALARATRRWSHLHRTGGVEPGPGTPDEAHAIQVRDVEDAVRATLRLLSRFDALEKEAGSGPPTRLVEQMRDLIKLEEEIESQLGTLLSILGEIKAWNDLKFTGVGHYGVERLRMSRTTAEDRARLERGLRTLPRVRRAYREGRIGAEAALLLCRLFGRAPAHEHVERAWIQRAAQVTIQRLRDEARVAARSIVVGQRAHELDSPAPAAPPDIAKAEQAPIGPQAPTELEAVPTVIGDQPVSAVAAANPTENAARPLETESPLTGALGPFTDVNSVPFPVADRNWQHSLQRAPGDGVRRITKLGAMAFERPIPDVFLRLRLPDDVAKLFVFGLEHQRRRLEVEADQAWNDDTWDEDTARSHEETSGLHAEELRPSTLAARMFGRRGRRPPTWVALLAMLEEYAHTWDQPGPRRAGDAVYIRAGWRCTAPGCTSRKNLEDHHIVYRSRGGSNELSNRTCLCRFHHQHGEHGGLASVRGQAPLDIIWRLGRGELAHWYRNDRLLAPIDNAWAPLRLRATEEQPRALRDPGAQ